MDITDLSELVDLHGRAIYGFCHKLANNRTDADDLYQETFLKAVELCHKIDKYNNPKGFLVSVSIGIWKNKRRKYARRKRIALFEEFNEDVINSSVETSEYLAAVESDPEKAVISNELKDMLQAAANSLNDKLRIPLYMYYTAGMSNEDISVCLKIPLGTVKSRLYKARKQLKNILELEVSKYEKF